MTDTRPRVYNPNTGRMILVGGKTYNDLYRGITSKRVSRKGNCSKYAHIPDKYLCGPQCGTDQCFPVNTYGRTNAILGPLNYARYATPKNKQQCIRKCAKRVYKKEKNNPKYYSRGSPRKLQKRK